MQKPKLKSSALPSTGLTKNLLTATYNHNHTSSFKTGMRNSVSPMISSFYKAPSKRVESYRSIPQSQHQSQQQSLWKNTCDIQHIIKRKIQVDSSLSEQNIINSAQYKYCLGQDRICAEKFMELPQPVKIAVRKMQSQYNEENVNLVYGYLKSIHSVYYIIEGQLFIYNVDDLKRSKERGSDVFKQSIKLRPNCRKIHQIYFPNSKIIPAQFKNKVLAFQYPYQIELCSYRTHETNTLENNGRDLLNGGLQKKNIITMINLNMRIPLETAMAQFITATSNGELLYLDENGLMNCLLLTKKDEAKLKRVTKKENYWKKKNFIRRNQGFIKAAKQYFWKVVDFRHSIYLPKRQNIALIFNQQRKRAYTLSVRGDRTSIVQEVKKIIKVYDIQNCSKDIQLNCIWSIQEEQLLSDILSSSSTKSKVTIFSIAKVQEDYNQEADLICVLSNGAQAYYQITKDAIKMIKLVLPPSLSNIALQVKARKQNLIYTSTLSAKETKQISSKMYQNYQIKPYNYSESLVKQFYGDRYLDLSLIRHEKKMHLHLSLKGYKESDKSYIFPVIWEGNPFFDSICNIENFPTENKIYEAQAQYFLNSTNNEIVELEKTQLKKEKKQQPRILRPSIGHTHEYLRQVYFSPRTFTYISSKFITSFTLVRPIDIVYYFVMHQEQTFCENYLLAITKSQPEQICCMLLQIYSNSDATYYVSKHYRHKIDALIDSMKNGSQLEYSLKDKTMVSKRKIQWYQKQQKKILEASSEDQLQRKQGKLSEETKTRLGKLFCFFSKQQKIAKSSIDDFHSIFLENRACSIQGSIQQLPAQQKFQVQNCLLYISRLLYPFWNSSIIINEGRRLALGKIKIKLDEVNDVVYLLKKIENPFHLKLSEFLNKMLQLVQMFDLIPHLPESLTLADAISKDPEYFEPYIFRTLRRQNSPQIIKLFKDKFPMYISKQFHLLVKIFMEIRVTSALPQIKQYLQRLPEYPQYFINFLLEQKSRMDLSFLRVKGDSRYEPIKLTIPDVPFVNSIEHIFSAVRGSDTHIDEKFKYLKQARKRLTQIQQNQTRQKQVVSAFMLSKLQNQHKQLLKCLHFQQQCKSQIIRIIAQQREERKHLSSSHVQGLFSKVLGSLGTFSQRDKNNSMSKVQYKMKHSSQLKRKIQSGYEDIFYKLEYFALNRNQLEDLIKQLDTPRLVIAFKSLFVQVTNYRSQKLTIIKQLKEEYHFLAEKGKKKVGISLEADKSQNKKIELMKYVKGQIADLYIFLNKAHGQLMFEPLYDGLKATFLNIDWVYNQILSKKQPVLYSVGRQLVELGFDKQVIFSHLLISLSTIFHPKIGENQGDQTLIKNWIYDWSMCFDMIRVYKKQSLEQLRLKTKDLMHYMFKALQDLKDEKQYLEQGQERIVRIVNQQAERPRRTSV